MIKGLFKSLLLGLALVCSANASQITIYWSAVKNAKYYEVYTFTDRLSTVQRVTKTKTTLDILDGIEYVFSVVAYDERGNASKPSSPIKYIKKLKIGPYRLETPTVKIQQ